MTQSGSLKSSESRVGARPRNGGASYRLTERDLSVAAFIDRVGVATPDQVRHRFGLSEPMCWRRLRALREHGRAKAARPLAGPSVLYPAGTPVPSVGHLDHALAATSVALALELQGAEVVTERQMRRDEYRAKDRTLWSIPMAAGQGIGRQPTHRPDMVIVEAHGLVAVEVELTRKSERRLGQLMAAWARQGRYHEVRYRCRSAFLDSSWRRRGSMVRTSLFDRRCWPRPCWASEPLSDRQRSR